MQITFLEGYRPLVKTYSPDGVDAYPLVKRLTSWEYEIEPNLDGLREKYRLVQKHANFGHGMLKGNLLRPIARESRSGLTNNEEPAHNIVLDIDGVRVSDLDEEPPYDGAAIRRIADRIIKWLPDCFQDVSYILHASASLGTKPGVYSLHLDFMLRDPVSVHLLKSYLLWLNFQIPEFEQELSLTATGTALRYKLDRSLADNSRIIYIGHPFFEGMESPIPDKDDRLQLVENGAPYVDLREQISQVNTRKLHTWTREKIRNLREESGLPPRNEKMQSVRINGTPTTVVTNPDHVTMVESYSKEGFVYYNVNGGDSNAYYVFKNNPQIVHNFKGEPNFLFEQAAPEAYKEHLERHGFGETESSEHSAPVANVPLVFRDMKTNKFYNALYNPKDQQLVRCDPVQGKEGCQDWMLENEAPVPDIIPSVDYSFSPTDDRRVDLAGGFINRYVPTELIAKPVEIEEEYRDLQYGQANEMEGICPTIYKIIRSITGEGDLEFEHFINWLAFVLQKKEKTMTAWVMHGTQGTGKGLFMNRIMAQILGKHAVMKRTENVDEDFNAWLRTAMLAGMDEFDAHNTGSRGKVTNKLKNYITEPMITVREMRTDQIDVRNYCNFLFFSNDRTPVVIQEGDRRFNVCPPQKVPIKSRHPDIEKLVDSELDKEIPIFASLLLHFDLNVAMARSALDNQAKVDMKNNGRTEAEEFCDNLTNGNLEAFLEILCKSPTPALTDTVLPAQNILKAWIRDIQNGQTEHKVFTAELRTLYSAAIGESVSDRGFGKMLARRGVALRPLTHRGIRRRGTVIQWNLEDINLDKVIENYLDDDTVAQFARGNA